MKSTFKYIAGLILALPLLLVARSGQQKSKASPTCAQAFLLKPKILHYLMAG
jgi:hypothetical protein